MKRAFDGERFAQIVEGMRERCDPPSLNELAHTTRVSTPTLSRILSFQRVPDPGTVERLARAFPDLAVPLYEAAGFDVPVSLIPIVAEVSARTGKPPMEIVDEAVRKLFDGE